MVRKFFESSHAMLHSIVVLIFRKALEEVIKILPRDVRSYAMLLGNGGACEQHSFNNHIFLRNSQDTLSSNKNKFTNFNLPALVSCELNKA